VKMRRRFLIIFCVFIVSVSALLLAAQLRTDRVNASRFDAIRPGIALADTEQLLGRPATKSIQIEVFDRARKKLVPTDRELHV
jgi:hypothetical protein